MVMRSTFTDEQPAAIAWADPSERTADLARRLGASYTPRVQRSAAHHGGRPVVVTLHSPDEQNFYGRTLEESLASVFPSAHACLPGLDVEPDVPAVSATVGKLPAHVLCATCPLSRPYALLP